MVWTGDPDAKLSQEQRERLLRKREDIVRQITELKAKPLPRGDQEQMARFRQRDLLELASKVVKIDQKLGRV